MSDRMTPLVFGDLFGGILKEYAKYETIKGVKPLKIKSMNIPLFGNMIESPFGPAAGPHTQLAGNIIAAYAGGARFFELKTVQKLDGDDLPVSKPCILAEDEGYNVEWSTELYVKDALAEYIRAWWALKLLSKEYGFGSPDGFIFNMSVGYDLAGIKLPKIDNFINTLKEAKESDTWKECYDWTKANLSKFKHVDQKYIDQINSKVSNSITISTLHGCPPDEIERIAVHLITEKGLNTFVKCNPTLLGYDFVRKTVDSLGFDYLSFGPMHYETDLQFKDAVPMFQRLMKLAAENHVNFGLKLSNTKPVDIVGGFLPGKEAYMSGRALFPLTINLADKISHEFNGKLPISYAGGADMYNAADIYKTGIFPITMATNLLKPGGYQRFTQLFETVETVKKPDTIDVNALDALAKKALTDSHYRKSVKTAPHKKIEGNPPMFDCFAAPCRNTCPIHQDIPAYLRAISEGDKVKAAEIIIERNPLPNITGTICPHTCMDSCNRRQYDGAVHIRACKLDAAQNGLAEAKKHIVKAAPNGKKAAVIGGGPAGIAAAYFLGKNGWNVTVYEKESKLGGIVRTTIPAFRISDEAIDADVDLLKHVGVKIVTGKTIDDPRSLEPENDAVFVAIGASKDAPLALKEGKSLNALEFLRDMKEGKKLDLGENVVVIGAGNTAMDTARVAKRAPGVKTVSIVYRRDVKNMPADLEELNMALEDGVKFCELLSPVTLKDGKLICEKMKLGEPDASGRKKPVPTGEMESLPCSTVIASLGERIDSEFYQKFGISVDEKGRPQNTGKFFFIGDGATGPKTVVEAISSAAKAAEKITDINFDHYKVLDAEYDGIAKRAYVYPEFKDEDSKRCLECEGLCGLCVETCPNRANVFVNTPNGKQIVHVEALCNECGNCAVFCPYDGRPYRDKLTFFATRALFDKSENSGWAPLGGGKYLLRYNGVTSETTIDAISDKTVAEIIKSWEE